MLINFFSKNSTFILKKRTIIYFLELLWDNLAKVVKYNILMATNGKNSGIESFLLN